MAYSTYQPYSQQRTYWKPSTSKASNLKKTTEVTDPATTTPKCMPAVTNADASAILGKLEAIADALSEALDALDEYLGAGDTEEDDASTEEEDASEEDEPSQRA